MKRVPGGGYTILEVMIFLVVSAALLMSAMAMIGGREERTRFSQAVTVFDQKMKDILNDVSTGTYPANNNVTCFTLGSTVTLGNGAAEQGTQSCLFVGKALQLSQNSPNYNVYTLVGAKNATSISDAGIKLMGFSGEAGPFESNRLPADIQIRKIASLTAPGADVRGIALISDFGQTDITTGAFSGNATRVTLNEIRNGFVSPLAVGNTFPATSGVVLCLEQGGGGRKAQMTIGGSNQQLSTDTQLVENWTGACT